MTMMESQENRLNRIVENNMFLGKIDRKFDVKLYIDNRHFQMLKYTVYYTKPDLPCNIY